MIEFFLNGETKRVAEASSLAALLHDLRLDTGKVAVECNEAIVPRSQYAQTLLHAGDRLEIVHFIGGG